MSASSAPTHPHRVTPLCAVRGIRTLCRTDGQEGDVVGEAVRARLQQPPHTCVRHGPRLIGFRPTDVLDIGAKESYLYAYHVTSDVEYAYGATPGPMRRTPGSLEGMREQR